MADVTGPLFPRALLVAAGVARTFDTYLLEPFG
jgi:hypothetical protein